MSLLKRSAILINLITKIHSSCALAVNGHKQTPEHNYGLRGKGKTDKKQWNKHQEGMTLKTEGEVVFGIHPVTLALVSNNRQHVYRLYLDSRHRETQSSQALEHIQELAAKQGVPVEFVSKSVMIYLSGNRPHQGVCLDASHRVLPELDSQEPLDGVELNPSLLWLLLYNVQDPMNFGAILRSSYFLGVNRVIVPKANSCAVSPVVSKASAGALEVMDIYQTDGSYRNLKQLAYSWQSSGGTVVGTGSVTDTGPHVSRLQDFTKDTATLLIVGNEGSGVDVDVLELCDTLLTIPPPTSSLSPSHGPDSLPHVDSLNVSVATGILLHWLCMAPKNS